MNEEKEKCSISKDEAINQALFKLLESSIIILKILKAELEKNNNSSNQ